MSRPRVELQAKLEEILGNRHVYFQPPASLRMEYPAIVYFRNRIHNRTANNAVYNQTDEYTVTVIDKYPDSDIVRKVSQLPMCQHDRHYTADNLNHDVFTIYY